MVNKQDCVIERIVGTGPGGQHRNKTASCVRVTHKPTGIVVRIDGRYQHKNLAMAMKELDRRISEQKADSEKATRKGRRDYAIKNEVTIRTYDFKSGLAWDHRTGKKAPLKEVLGKGRFELISPTDRDFG